MKNFGKIAAVALATWCATPVWGMILVENGKSDYVIVRSATPSPSERYAAEELCDYLEKCTGARLKIVDDSHALPSKAIVLGKTRHLKALLGDTMLSPLGEDGFRLLSKPPHLMVIGSPKRGALYGVYALLEKFAGCRWYASWHTVTPRTERLEVADDLDLAEVPDFAMRTPYWHDVISQPAFAARLKVNARGWGVEDEKFGGNSFRFGGDLVCCHTFDTLMPPKEFFAEHPEYYSDRNGHREGYQSQLCLTNPDVLKIVTERVLERIRKDPGAKFYGVSQNDWDNHCLCEKCLAVEKEEESPSGPMIRFVNAVAEAVEKEFPDAIIETLAYTYTRKPPKFTKVRHNVVPCLCTIECDFANPIATSKCEDSVKFLKDLEGWKRQTDALYLWDYTVNFKHYLAPFPNYAVLQDNLRLFRDSGVKEIFAQGGYQGRHAEFAELKAWLLAKWMWKVDTPEDELVDDFMNGYYGKGAKFVRKYYDEVKKRELAYTQGGAKPLKVYDDVDNPALGDEFIAKAAKCWDLAEKATADDAATHRNVLTSRLSVDYVLLERLLARVGGKLCLSRGERPSAADFERIRTLARRLVEAVDSHKVVLAEGKDTNAERIARYRKIASGDSSWMPQCGDRGIITAESIPLGAHGRGGERVDDPAATCGKALKFFNTHHEWCVQMPLNEVRFDDGVKYRLRARVRVDKAGEGSAFSVGVYDKEGKRVLCSSAPTTDKTSADYAWYDIGVFEPKPKAYIWMAPGVFDSAGKSAINAVYVDAIELSRADCPVEP